MGAPRSALKKTISEFRVNFFVLFLTIFGLEAGVSAIASLVEVNQAIKAEARRPMLPLVVGLLHAPRPHGDGHALKLLQQGQGCLSIADATVASVVDDAWCDENCAATPDYEGCIGMCQCPQVAVD